MLRVRVEYRDKEIDRALCSVAWYRQLYRGVLAAQPELTPLDTTVVLVDNPRIKELNTAYRGHPRVTDVLSFRYDEESGESHGELFISLPVAQVQARRYKVTLAKEMARLAIHGFFHLHGYDHMKAGERAVMRGLERHAMRYALDHGLC